MKKITAHEHNLALGVVESFTGNRGETATNNLSKLIGVDEMDLKVWVMQEGLFWPGYESLPTEAIPKVWSAFAKESRPCQALHEAYKELKKTSKKGSPLREWARECEAKFPLVKAAA